MTDKPEPSIDRGPLRFDAISRRWEILGTGNRSLVELTSGDVVFFDVGGTMKLTRIEYTHDGHGGGRYVSVDGYRLADGIEAALANR